jgi:mannose-6-phosphate isomerase-like protein (cupin superfamily)
MTRELPEALEKLIAITEARQPLGVSAPANSWVVDPCVGGAAMYENRNERLNIDFKVQRLAFPDVQTMDPRVVRIAPSKNNENHKHAHESLFVILEGEGEVRVGDAWSPVKAGEVAYVPRQVFHQTRNTSADQELVILAITDFGFTSAVLGDYDKRTRLAEGGSDVTAQ